MHQTNCYKVGQVKEIYELKGAGRSIREIARELDVSRNTVRKYPCFRRGSLAYIDADGKHAGSGCS